MKKLIITICMALIMGSIVGQAKYEEGMQKAFDLIEEKKIDESVALFERIAQVEKDNWLPSYHAGHTLIRNSFKVMNEDARLNMLERAKSFIVEAHKRSPKNPEIMSLEAMLYTSYMAFDPATYGMMYAMQIEGIHERAYQLAPDNPRVLIGKIQYDFGKANFFGQDTSSYCEEMKKIIPKLKEEKITEPFAPSHGLREAEGFIQQCK